MTSSKDGIKMPSNIDMPTCILYGKILQIDKQFEQFIPGSCTQVDISNLIHRNRYEKRFQVLIRRNENKIKEHFGRIPYSQDNGEARLRYFWILYPEETRYMFTATRNLGTRLVSASLENKIHDALVETLKPKEQSVNVSLFHYLSSIERDITEDRHYTINSKGEMTFTPKGKETIIADDVWKTQNRQSIKYGKGIRKIFENNLFKVNDDVIEKVSNYVKSAFTFNGTFQIVNGSDIRKWYNEKHYGHKTGTLSQSCMRYDTCQSYLDIYVNNPNKVEMIVALQNDKIIGRALLWTADNYERKIMDRVYGNDLTIEAFKEYAKEQNWVYKKYQSHSETNDWVNTDDIPHNVCVTLNIEDVRQFPYIDSFRYAEEMSDKITLYADYNMNNYEFNNISGGYEGSDEDDERIRCYCGNYYDEDDTVYSNYIDEHIYEPDAVYSEFHDAYLPSDMAVRMNGDYVDPEHDDICYSDYNDRYYYYEDVVFVENESDYYEPNQVVEDFQGEFIPIDEMKFYSIDITILAESINATNEEVLTALNRYIPGELTNDNEYQVHYNENHTDVERIIEYIKQTLEIYITQTT